MSANARQTRMLQVVEFARAYFFQHGHMPSYSTIAAELRITDRQTVRRFVVQAEAAGHFVRDGEWTAGAGRGHRRGARIRFGYELPAGDVPAVTQVVKMGRDL